MYYCYFEVISLFIAGSYVAYSSRISAVRMSAVFCLSPLVTVLQELVNFYTHFFFNIDRHNYCVGYSCSCGTFFFYS